MEEYDRDNFDTERPLRPRPHKTSQQPPSHAFADDFGDGFSGGKAKVKAKSMVYRDPPSTNALGVLPLSAKSRPRYKRDTALHISSSEDSADEMNLCPSQPEAQSRSRRAGSRPQQTLSNPPERKQSTPRSERGMMQPPAKSARPFGKQKGNRVVEAVPSPSKKEKERRSSRNVPSNALSTGLSGRTVSSSRICLRPSGPQRAPRGAHSVASTASSKVQLRQRPLLSGINSSATPGDHPSFTELIPPRRSPRTLEESLRPSDRLVVNRLRNEKRNNVLLPTSQKGNGATVSSTISSSCTRDSGSSTASTRRGWKQFETGGESSFHQLKDVPWADLVNFPSSPVPTTPKSSRTGTSKSSQSSSLFPVHLTPPDLQMKNQAILDELERSRKRKRSSMKEVPDLSDDGGAADTTISYSQIIRESDVDPTTLCPFCDDPLPANPSTKLRSQLAYFRETCESEQRWGNSMGLTAPINVFVGFCALHTAETKVIPQGLRYGWPQEIDFKSVATRVRRLESKLRAVIEDPDGRGAAFYGPLKEAAARYGIGAVTGSKGSWNSFKSVHAGYGEKGVVVISQILFDLFPSIPGNKVQPFDADFFRSHVLVPEAALLLIREDLSTQPKWTKRVVPRGVAFEVLQRSAAYGKAMFAEEDDTDGVADQAVRQRASVRRKEIEREEQKEAEQKKQQRNSRAGSTAEKERDQMPREVEKVDSWRNVLGEFSSSDLDETPATIAPSEQPGKRTRSGGNKWVHLRKT